MKVGVVSDTHGDVPGAQRALRVLGAMGVDLVIHCGDVGANVVPCFRDIPTHFVPGNMDAVDQLRAAVTLPEHQWHDPLGELELEGRRVAFLHGHDIKLLRHTIYSNHWDLVCHGHTHVFSRAVEGKTLVLNPGALTRTNRPSLAVVEFPPLEVTEIPL
jgi:uncharacterized protein